MVQKHKRIKKELQNWESQGKPLPPPHLVKQLTIQHYQKKYKYKTFIETGTCHGDMVQAQMNRFKSIKSIELADKLYEEAKERFKKFKHIEILHGDSSSVLPNIVNGLKRPAIFWLDGHYSEGETARGEKDCPIFEELAAIFENNKQHIILIDDARDFVGKDDYPTIKQVSTFIKQRDSRYKLKVENDIIRAYI